MFAKKSNFKPINEFYPLILVVDDDLYNIEVVTAMLVSLNHKSESAISGMSALVKMQDRIELMREGKAQMY